MMSNASTDAFTGCGVCGWVTGCWGWVVTGSLSSIFSELDFAGSTELFCSRPDNTFISPLLKLYRAFIAAPHTAVTNLSTIEYAEFIDAFVFAFLLFPGVAPKSVTSSEKML